MEQKQRRAKANPFGEGQNEEEGEALPSPPPIDDVLKAAEMAQEEQRKAKEEAEAAKGTKLLYSKGSDVLDGSIPGRSQWGTPEIMSLTTFLTRSPDGKNGFWVYESHQIRNNAADYVCICLDGGCRIGPFIRRNGRK